LAKVPVGTYALYTLATGNFHEVVPGQVFRSGQMNKNELTDTIQRHGLKSVLNLRGKNTGKDWYDDELAVCAKNGVAHYDVPLSAGKDVPAKRMEALVEILKKASKPLLIHCKNEADRAAFGSALYYLAVEGQSEDMADDELTIWYGHIPRIIPSVAAMNRSFSQYAKSHVGAGGTSPH
jgi:protein tyrosine/serine phosphatase